MWSISAIPPCATPCRQSSTPKWLCGAVTVCAAANSSSARSPTGASYDAGDRCSGQCRQRVVARRWRRRRVRNATTAALLITTHAAPFTRLLASGCTKSVARWTVPRRATSRSREVIAFRQRLCCTLSVRLPARFVAVCGDGHGSHLPHAQALLANSRPNCARATKRRLNWLCNIDAALSYVLVGRNWTARDVYCVACRRLAPSAPAFLATRCTRRRAWH